MIIAAEVVLWLLLVIAIFVVFVTQVVDPLINNKLVFPFLRRRAKLQHQKVEVQEEIEVVREEDEVLKMASDLEKIRERQRKRQEQK